MAWTQADLDQIDKAIADPTVDVYFGDRRRTNRNATDLIRLRAEIANYLAQQSAQKTVRQVRVYTDSGWGQ